MESKRTALGVGPKIAAIALPAVTAAAAATALWHDAFRMTGVLPRPLELAAGTALLAAGAAFYGATVRRFLREFPKGGLVTTGTFAWCRNPIYASFIVFFVPASALLADSWLLLPAALAMYGGLKLFIGQEYESLEEEFGDAFRRYAASVNEVLPMPPRVGHAT